MVEEGDLEGLASEWRPGRRSACGWGHHRQKDEREESLGEPNTW